MAGHRHTPDHWTTERLVSGHLVSDDAPPGYRRVAHLLSVAGTKPTEEQAPAGSDPVGSLVAAIQHELSTQPSPLPRRSRVFSKIVVAKALAALSVLTLSATGAAAATGNLPSPVQDGLANAAEHVGVTLPESEKAKDKAEKAEKADKGDADGKGVERVTENCVPASDGTFARNRGQYLQQERAKSDEAFEAAKKTRCGMPVQSEGTPGADDATETPGADDATETPDSPDASDHGKSAEDHGKAGDDHGKAGDDHGKAGDHPTKDDHPGGRP